MSREGNHTRTLGPATRRVGFPATLAHRVVAQIKRSRRALSGVAIRLRDHCPTQWKFSTSISSSIEESTRE
jgi:hypothetical protein